MGFPWFLSRLISIDNGDSDFLSDKKYLVGGKKIMVIIMLIIYEWLLYG